MTLVVKNPPATVADIRDLGSIRGSGRSAREWQSTPVFLPGEFHGQRRLAVYSSWDHKELVTTELCSLTQIKS